MVSMFQASTKVWNKNVEVSLLKSDFEDNKEARIYANVEFSDIVRSENDTTLSQQNAWKLHASFSTTKDGLSEWFMLVSAEASGWKNVAWVYDVKKANLSKVYTNHCIRATIVTNLREDEFDRSMCYCTTGHKNERSVELYDRSLKERTLSTKRNRIEMKPLNKNLVPILVLYL